MNEHVRQPDGPKGRFRPTTQAAEGVPRWRWTFDELVRMTDMGVFAAEDRIELIGGEIVPMSPVGRRHEVVADEIHRFWGARIPPEVWITSERQLYLDEISYTKPDIWIMPADLKAADVQGTTVLLVVEVADSSLSFDKTKKAAVYAQHGVREYWVVDAQALVATVHRGPAASGYTDVTTNGAAQTLTPLLVPQLSVRLSELDLGD